MLLICVVIAIMVVIWGSVVMMDISGQKQLIAKAYSDDSVSVSEIAIN